jgi:hypothetical protein
MAIVFENNVFAYSSTPGATFSFPGNQLFDPLGNVVWISSDDLASIGHFNMFDAVTEIFSIRLNGLLVIDVANLA